MTGRLHTLLDRRHDGEDLSIAAHATNSESARALYKKRTPIYPKLGNGRFRTLKWAAMVVLLTIYYLTPWIRWDRGAGAPDQAVLIDFGARRFYFFFIELWPQEIYFVTGLLVVAAVGIFLSSALLGRVWCGYACPQTVWTDLFIHVERWIEGDRAARIRLAKAPFTASKMVKKVTKHALWLTISVLTGGAWIFYFSDAPALARAIVTGEASAISYFFIALFTFTTYSLAGTMREQVCTYLCPWPRIQAAMIDKDALSVTYRVDRGEPRGAHKKGDSWDGRGDCIDCRQCVAVCPQGIDIRDGDQLECINCALCIDACDAIMDRINRPRGLVAYDSYENVARRARGEPTRTRFIRPRTLFYASIMCTVTSLMTYGLLHRQTLSIDASRDRNPAFVRLADGSVRNAYAVRFINKARSGRNISLGADGSDDLAISAFGASTGQDGKISLHLKPDGVTTARIYVSSRSSNVLPRRFQLVATDRDTGDIATREVVFVSGGNS